MRFLLLEGKHIVIIGGTTGIGFSAAKALLLQGAGVVVVGRDPESISRAGHALGKNAVTHEGDALIPDTAAAAIARCVQRFGSFHGLYHVAGGSGRSWGDGKLDTLPTEAWTRTLDWNLTSLMLSNQAAVKAFLAQGTGGTILNLGSVLAFDPSPHYFSTHAYAAAKAAIIGFSKSVAATYAEQNIRINVLAPGLVDTPMARRAVADDAIRSFIKTKQPLDGGRVGQPEDLDGLAVYFMSDQSRFTTGQVVAVDGGWSLSDGQWGR